MKYEGRMAKDEVNSQAHFDKLSVQQAAFDKLSVQQAAFDKLRRPSTGSVRLRQAQSAGCF